MQRFHFIERPENACVILLASRSGAGLGLVRPAAPLLGWGMALPEPTLLLAGPGSAPKLLREASPAEAHSILANKSDTF